MIGLITSGATSAAAASAADDHSIHSASSVKMSSSTLLSTRTPLIAPPRQRHDLVGGHPDVAGAAQARDNPLAARRARRLAGAHDPHGLPDELELDLGAGHEAG